MVIIDPGLTISMPPRITAISGIDALAHAVDALMSKYCNPFFDSLACGAVELIARHLRRAFRDGQDLESRYSMSLAAMMAMMAVDGKGVALYSHSIAYILAAFKPVPHGIGCGVALPYTMGLNLPLIEDRLANVARIMGERAAAVSQRTAAERAVEAVYKLISDVGLPLGLKEMGYRQDDLPQMAEICLQKYRREYNPKALTAEDSLALFQAMWEGKIRYWEA
jgi:alcohol dehydrogenase